MIKVNGSYGEGGGQILRTSLALSMVTGKPFQIVNIRSGRKKPGLLRQHLTAVKASAEISGAEIKGADMGSGELSFSPGQLKGGEYHFAIGTAGSCTLVLQAVLPALLTAAEPSVLVLEGGTHNPYAPPYDFLAKSFLLLLGKMGCKVETEIERYGFYPAGGGKFTAKITPAKQLQPIELMETGQVIKKQVRAISSQIPDNIGPSEVELILRAMSWGEECGSAEEVHSPGPGNAVMIEMGFEQVTEVFTGFGEIKVPLKKVARNAYQQAQRYLAAGVPVGRFLADQLLIPLAMAGKGKFRTLAPSMHTQTNVEIVQKFLEVKVQIEQLERDVWEIEIK